ncbi:hypothetical protein [Parasediminibacterium sp. JCM 36343]|uniref:hypothetical protein n=1 Tax=Parasediminibacterium sp. JCM 36343 TaxID=3374279 RepID=UPI00397D6A29
MATVILLTDFSDSSRNALSYACHLLPPDSIDLLLLNIYPTPFSFAGDGVALVALKEALETNQIDLENELEWAAENFPTHSIRYKEVMGEFVSTLDQQFREESAVIVILGIPVNSNGIPLWETDMLGVLTGLAVPVLTIPHNATYKPLLNIGFACKPENIKDYTPIEKIEKLVNFTKAKLHVVRVIPIGSDPITTAEGEVLLKEKLKNVAADYYTIEGGNLLEHISSFIQEHAIDMLVIRPRKYGIWYKLFHKDHSRQLATLGMIPVLALHEADK